MRDPRALRSKAALIRGMAERSDKPSRATGRSYLLTLADSFEREARRIEREMAGAKPGSATIEPRPEPAAEAAPERSEPPAPAPPARTPIPARDSIVLGALVGGRPDAERRARSPAEDTVGGTDAPAIREPPG